ncbi:MAG: CAP domain-containing protein [Anaerolineales bacterium]|jgi:LysM repeat protein
MKRTRKIIFILLSLILFVGVKTASASTNIHSPLTNSTQLIAAINNYRKDSGVHPLSENSKLMSLAQTQCDYQASIGTYSHTGSDGSTPTERAYAAGYGGGNKIFLSEIVYMGYQATIDDAMAWWKESSLHNRVMLDSQYLEIGAGISTDGDWTYFTAEIAWVTSVSAPADAGKSSPTEDTDDALDDSASIIIPIVKATPDEDGSIIHILQEGQTLWAIAAVYEVDLDSLLSQNNLTRNSIVFPGDQIIVQPAEQGAQDDTALEGTKPPIIGEAVSLSTKGTPTKKSIYTQTPEFTTTVKRTENPSVQWVVIVAFAVIFIVVIGSLFIQKPPERPSNDDVVR